MKTLFFSDSDSDINEAANFLNRDELIVFPTETVYGLGANADSSAAVGKIFTAKNRPADNPLIVHLSDISMAGAYAVELSVTEKMLLEEFAPGPLTIIVDRLAESAVAAAAGHPTVGLRIPSSYIARKLIRACGFGIAAPSANRSGKPSPTSFDMAVHEMGGKVAGIIRGGDSEKGLESTILRCTKGQVIILRPGSISADKIRMVVERSRLNLEVLGAAGNNLSAAPGTRYRHYAPDAELRLFADPCELEGLLSASVRVRVMVIAPAYGPYGVLRKKNQGHKAYWSNIDSLDDYAHQLYKLFYTADVAGVAKIFAWLPEKGAEATALIDRLIRASAK